jgi:hypothetical protein
MTPSLYEVCGFLSCEFVYSCSQSVILPCNQTTQIKLFEVYRTHGSDYEERSFLGCGVL